MFVFRNQGSQMKKHFISLEPRKTLGQNMRFLKLKTKSQNIESGALHCTAKQRQCFPDVLIQNKREIALMSPGLISTDMVRTNAKCSGEKKFFVKQKDAKITKHFLRLPRRTQR